MDPEPSKFYRSYLIRCWLSSATDERAVLERAIVETVSEAPQHWGFSTLDDLLGFLRVKLLEQEHEPRRPTDREDNL
jgi:hypothetical protein